MCGGLGDGGLGLVQQAVPDVLLERQVFLKRKAAVDAGRNVASDLRGFDRNRARAATRVVQRHAVFAQLVPAAGGNHGGGQRFFQRCIAFVFAPAALEQRLARGVDVNRHGLHRQVHVHAHVGPTRIDIRAHIELGAKTVGNCVLDLQGGKVQAGQRAVLRGDLDFEGLFRREPDFPGDIGSGVVQVLLAAVLVVLQFDQHALGQAAVQVQLQGVTPRALQLHTRAPGFARDAGDALDLGGQQGLNAGGARQK